MSVEYSMEPTRPMTAALYVYDDGTTDVVWNAEWVGRLDELAVKIRTIGERMVIGVAVDPKTGVIGSVDH